MAVRLSPNAWLGLSMTDRCLLDPAAAADVIRASWPVPPRLGIVIGSGLGGLTGAVDVRARIPYRHLPGFPMASAPGHAGEFIGGYWAGVPVAMLCGRCHLYEGYSRAQVTFPLRVLERLGTELLLLSCAAGGLNPQYSPGELMLITGHVDLSSAPVQGDRLVATAICLKAAVGRTDRVMNERLREIAVGEGITLHHGVYAAVTGPNYETRAEVRFLQRVADAVGMSTVLEIEAAAELGVPVAAIALITNSCSSERLQQTTSEEVLSVAASVQPVLRRLVCAFLAGL